MFNREQGIDLGHSAAVRLREPVTPAFAVLLPKPALASLIEEQRGPRGGPYLWQSRPKGEPRDLAGGILDVPVDSFFPKAVVAQYDELADRVARAKALIPRAAGGCRARWKRRRKRAGSAAA